MASNFTEIEKCLIAAVNSVDNTTPREYPGKDLEDSDKGNGLWLKLRNLRSISEPVTLGDKGEDNHPGILQIDINYQRNKGSQHVLEKADIFYDFFTAGKTLTYNTTKVKVLSATLSPGRYVGGYYRVSLSVNYYSRTTRS